MEDMGIGKSVGLDGKVKIDGDYLGGWKKWGDGDGGSES